MNPGRLHQAFIKLESRLQGSLLRTKFEIPQIGNYHIRRERLLKQLDDGLRQNRCLTLISAPAGAGKTILAADWAARANRRFIWLSLEDSENELMSFLRNLLFALQQFQPQIGQALEHVFEKSYSVSVKWLASVLVEEISVLSEPFVLVLDNYQVIKSDEISAFVMFLIEHQPAQLHIMILTRAEPSLPVSRLRVSRQLTELGTANLRFTSEETLALMELLLGEHVLPDTAAKLQQRAEGWAAGLQLAGVALRALPKDDAWNVDTFLEHFGGDYGVVAAYLVEEVLRQVSEEEYVFLRQLSLLESFTLELAAVVSERKDVETILSRLQRENIFLELIDEKYKVYRFHTFLREFFAAELSLPEQAVIQLRVGCWFEEQGLLEKAIQSYLAGEAYDQAAQLILQTAGRLFAEGKMMALLGWLDMLPQVYINQQRELLLYQGVAMIFKGEIDMAAGCLEKASLLQAHTGNLSAGLFFGLKALLCGLRSDNEAVIEYGSQALTYLDKNEPFFSGYLTICLAQANLALGKVQDAQRGFYEAVRLGEQNQQAFTLIVATTNLVQLMLTQAQRREAELICRRLINSYDRKGAREPYLAFIYIAAAGIAFEGGDYPQVKQWLDDGLQLGLPLGPAAWCNLAGCILQARLNSVYGNVDESMNTLQELKPIAARLGEQSLRWVEAEEGDILLSQGSIAPLDFWATGVSFGRAASRQELLERERVFFIYIRYLLLRGRVEESRSLLEQTVETARLYDCRSILIYSAVWLAQVYTAIGLEDKGACLLVEALDLAVAEGIVAPFLHLPQELLRLYQHHQKYGQFVERVFAASCLSQQREAEKSKQAVAEDLIEALNSREEDILKLLAAGLSNQEIADRFFLSLNTIKWHIRNLYGKLGVRNRTQAVGRGRELGLL